MKLLIIDDNPSALAVAKSRLAKEPVDILCAEGGEAGLQLARQEHPDLILLDVDMPDMGGFDVCRNLKANAELCTIPVIFLSGSGDADDKVKGLDLGAVDYVTKPFDVFELRARVRAALRTKHLQDLLIEYANIDPLTGLPNRRALIERLQGEWARIDRHGGALSFVMVDVDHFKRVNDTYGHSIGDRVLQELAHVLVRTCRDVDMSARYGGEEFALVAPDNNISGAHTLAERCRDMISALQVKTSDGILQTTASFGVADTMHCDSIETLISHADTALYRAKREGRNTVRCYAPSDSGSSDGPSPDGTWRPCTVSDTLVADSKFADIHDARHS